MRASVFTQGRKLGGDYYIISIFDCYPSGLLIRAYSQTASLEYTTSPSEENLSKAGLSRTDDDYQKLFDSMELTKEGDKMVIECKIPGLKRKAGIPSGDAAKEYISSRPAGAKSMTDLLTVGLTELCKAKPAGMDAVRWLRNWLLENNPNQPQVEIPE